MSSKKSGGSEKKLWMRIVVLGIAAIVILGAIILPFL
jgi:hypothetical protein